jgi:polysaccharide pyruvyl transferase WcaK-like protein
MVIEIRNAGFLNKGAELMLLSIISVIKERYPDSVITMAPTAPSHERPVSKMLALGIAPKLHFYKYGLFWSDLSRIIPKRFITRYGLVTDQDVDLVLDASGFAYGDVWGRWPSENLQAESKRWRRSGTKTILLPQSFGPFSDNKHRVTVSKWVNNVDMIFARDHDSYINLTSVVGSDPKIRIAPDFTQLIPGAVPPSFDPALHQVAIVPNYRIAAQGGAGAHMTYISFLIQCAEIIKQRRENPFLLVHEGAQDNQIAQKVAGVLDLPVIADSNPLHLKGILGACKASIGSRYHGLVSSLSQGVPSIAIGWSHKYSRLLEEYEIPDSELKLSDSMTVVEGKISRLLDPVERDRTSRHLLLRAAASRTLTEEMWSTVFEYIAAGVDRAATS